MSAGDIDLSTVSATAGATPAKKKHRNVSPQDLDLDLDDLSAEAALVAEDAPERSGGVLTGGYPSPSQHELDRRRDAVAADNRPAAIPIPAGAASALVSALEREALASPEKAERLRRLDAKIKTLNEPAVKAEPRSAVDGALDRLTEELNLLAGTVDALEIKLEPVRTPAAAAQDEDLVEGAPASPLVLRIHRLARSLELEVRRLQRLHRDLEL